MNSNIQRSENIAECPKMNENTKQASFKMSLLGNRLYKLSIIGSQEENSVLKLHFNTESGKKVMEPIVYLDLSNENQNLPKIAAYENGIPESSILSERFNCHSNNSARFTYGFEFNNLEIVSFSPREYSYQFDVATDLCKNIFQFKPEMNNEVVLTKHILNQFCYEIDNNQVLKLSVPSAPVTPVASTEPQQKSGFLGVLKQPVMTPEQKYRSEINASRVKLSNEVGDVWANYGKNFTLLRNKLIQSMINLPKEEEATITAIKAIEKEDAAVLSIEIAAINTRSALEVSAAGTDQTKLNQIHAQALVDTNTTIMAEQANITKLDNEIKATKQTEKTAITAALVEYKQGKIDLFNSSLQKMTELSAKAAADQAELSKKLTALNTPTKSAISMDSGESNPKSLEK